MIEIVAKSWGDWSRCSFCGKPVRWATIAATNKRQQFDDDFTVAVSRDRERIDEGLEHVCGGRKRESEGVT